MPPTNQPEENTEGARRAQIFHPSTNTISRVSIFGGLFILAGLVIIIGNLNTSPYLTGVDVVIEQPVQFSHEHHVSGLGIGCLYCHNSVEQSSFAGIPPTETCMTCHSQIWTNAAMLEPVRESWRTGEPIVWNRVYDLPDHVYFNHSIHVQKGVGCSTCHGQVDEMPLTWKAQSLHMEWCLGCHREPERFIRPRNEVYNMDWVAPENQIELGRRLVQEYNINVGKLTDCWVCHR
jgi:hypothetical protein